MPEKDKDYDITIDTGNEQTANEATVSEQSNQPQERTVEQQHPSTDGGAKEAPFATRAREWGEKFRCHWQVIEDSEDIEDAANAKRNLMKDTLREMEMKLIIAKGYFNKRDFPRRGPEIDPERVSVLEMQHQIADLMKQMDPMLRDLEPEKAPEGYTDEFIRKHQGLGYVATEERADSWKPTVDAPIPPPAFEAAASPDMTTMDYLKGINQAISVIEEKLASVLLGEYTQDPAPPGREMSESGELAHSALMRLGRLIQRLDL